VLDVALLVALAPTSSTRSAVIRQKFVIKYNKYYNE
jgi:hypothetical protein